MTTTTRRKKRKVHKAKLIEHLPTNDIHIHLEGADYLCELCGDTLKVMGEKVVREEVIFIPARLEKNRYIEHSYDCQACRKQDISSIKRAQAPKAPLQNSLASPSVIAWVMHQKYNLSLPLYRQEKEWQNYGLLVSRKTLANWLIRASEEWLQPIYERLRQYLIKEPVIHADETPYQILNRSDGKPSTSQARIWLFQAVQESQYPITYYHSSLTRSRENIIEVLSEEFEGYCHCDGYVAYQNIPGLTVVGCWAHMRRKFVDASGDKGQAAIGVAYCNQLFALERRFENLSTAERKWQRQIQLKPILKEFWEWLEQLPVLAKSKLGQAVAYGRHLKEELMRVLEDGRLALSNNLAERKIRPLTIGRKNFLFSKSELGATTNAIVYSIMETAKANGLNPYSYLCRLLTDLPNLPFRQQPELIETYMPWAQEIQDFCK
ncbi:IS66 family transposase [Vagococcus zengguangii]|uniref:IS66 family transposase n=1 Tax=Vagococcus zengguangii TaxID=2571750 RepID=A0A4D7CTB7_9ENTE|nr:IS66 family transposase [Vagococcus zengguangii]QCI86294.1 IS66 family transposase [Vagococcus zengguangii]